MFLRLFFLFSFIPLIELYILLSIGRVIGSLNTILLVIITGVLGAYLAQNEGLKTMQKIRHLISKGEMPGNALLDALLILIAGIVLLTPGVITDFVGLLLLFPPSRKPIRVWIRKRIEEKMSSQTITIHQEGPFT